MTTLKILFVLLCTLCSVSAHAQDPTGPEELPPLAQAVLDSAISLELASLPGQPLTLEDAQAMAREGATRVRIARADARAASGAVLGQKGSYDPELYGDLQRLSDSARSASPFAGDQLDMASGEAGVRWKAPLGTELSVSLSAVRLEDNSPVALLRPEYSAVGGLLVTQPLLDGFGVGERGDLTSAERRQEAAEARLANALLATQAGVEAVYWELYAAGRDFTVQRIITQRAAALLTQAETRTRIGVSGPADVANAQVFLAEQQQASLDTRERLGDASDVLAALIGYRPSGTNDLFRPIDEPPADFPIVPVDNLISAAKAGNFQLQGLERDTEAVRARYDQARRNALPDLDLFGGIGGSGLSGTPVEVSGEGSAYSGDLGDGVSQVFQGEYPNWRVGLSFSIPIGNWADGGERDRLAAEVVRAEQTLEEVRREIDASVRAAYRALANGRDRLDAARFGIDAANEQVRIGVLEYESGRTSAFELVRLGGDLAASQQRYSRALVRTAKAAAVLRVLTGGAYPTEETRP